MSEGLVTMSYLVSGIFFVLSLGGLSRQETARRGNLYGIIGMTLAILATFLGGQVENFKVLVPLMLGGALIGAIVAKRVEMTSMPELVAILHSFVGLAAVFVGFASDRVMGSEAHPASALYASEVGIDIFIGALTFILLAVAAVFFGRSNAGREIDGWQSKNRWKQNLEIFSREEDEEYTTIAHKVPGTVALVFVLLVSFVVYYFANWKALADVWQVS